MSKSWFDVDKDGLKEMFANFPPERMVSELVQNCWDTAGKLCAVTIKQDAKTTKVIVEDDNPDGFKNIRDAYTLFGSTEKRSDPTVRGRYNLGEKLVIARAISASVRTTTGTIMFNASGRHAAKDGTDKGSKVIVTLPRWSDKELNQALAFLCALYVPKGIKYTLNGERLKYVKPLKEISTRLSTEYVKTVKGQQMMTKTSRRTKVWFYHKRQEKAHLCEMGIPVCTIGGTFDVDVQQKVPLSQDRTLVPQSFLQDIYAEMLMALHDRMKPGDLGQSHVRMAMEDDRMDPETAANMFHQQFGDNAVIQSHDPDSDQEAARSGATIVSSRTFGSGVNHKLRAGGIATTKERFCRDRDELEKTGLPEGFREVKDSPARDHLRKYVQFLCRRFYEKNVVVIYATWNSFTTMAFYSHGQSITFNVKLLKKAALEQPVSKLTSIVLHELAHCMGTGHDGVYDKEFERLVNEHTALLASEPKLYKKFEPELFVKKAMLRRAAK